MSVNVIKYLGEFYFKKEMWFHFCCLHNITECWQHLFIEHADYKSNSQREISCRRTMFHNEIKKFMNLHLNILLNTFYLTDSYIMKVKIGLEFFFLKFPHAGDCFSLLHKVPKIKNSITKLTIFPHGGMSNFTIIFSPKIVFLDTDSILRVKTTFTSVK